MDILASFVQPSGLDLIQQSLFAALRAAARVRILVGDYPVVAVATGLGKTWLAAFDVVAVGKTLGRPPRVLIIAHRAEILIQAEDTFTPGLTATPERTDGVDVASLFDDVLAWHATVGDGIVEGSLVPFHYLGIKDDVDFAQIPWRNGRFDPAALEERLENSQRMERLWTAWQVDPDARTLVLLQLPPPRIVHPRLAPPSPRPRLRRVFRCRQRSTQRQPVRFHRRQAPVPLCGGSLSNKVCSSPASGAAPWNPESRTAHGTSSGRARQARAKAASSSSNSTPWAIRKMAAASA